MCLHPFSFSLLVSGSKVSLLTETPSRRGKVTVCCPRACRPQAAWNLQTDDGNSLIAQLVKNPPAMQGTSVRFLGQEDPLEKGGATHSSILGLPRRLSRERICLQCGSPGFDPWVRKIRWRRERPPTPVFLGFPGGSAGKESACNVGALGSIPGLGRSPGEGNGCPLQYPGLENSMDCAVCGVAKSRTRLSNFHFPIQLLLTSSPTHQKNVQELKTPC